MNGYRYLAGIVTGSVSLLKGMRVTFANMVSRPHTVQWPRQTAPLPARFRGHIRMLADEETGFPRCFACGSCARICPSACITVQGRKPGDRKKKVAVRFLLDFTKCSLCGLCVESCPARALTFSRDYALAGYRDTEFRTMDLLEGLASPFQF
ncbi:NuoI/complex I 23 kDa subunit family protein [Thermodesulfobacteriota bacterium B35]